MMSLSILRRPAGCNAFRMAAGGRMSPIASRWVSTLPNNEYIYVHDHPNKKDTKILSLLDAEPPVESVALGTTTKVPPTPESFRENPSFRRYLQYVIAQNAKDDPDVQNIAKSLFAQSEKNQEFFRLSDRERPSMASISEHAFKGAGVGGWVHISDLRNPPDVNRSPDPEDIFGSVECDKDGNIVGGFSGYQACEAYRIITNKGPITLSNYLRERLVEKLKEKAADAKK